MKRHSDHASLSFEPLEVVRVVQCGQHRFIDGEKGVDDLTKTYRIEPNVPGVMRITYHSGTKSWSFSENLGADIGGCRC